MALFSVNCRVERGVVGNVAYTTKKSEDGKRITFNIVPETEEQFKLFKSILSLTEAHALGGREKLGVTKTTIRVLVTCQKDASKDALKDVVADVVLKVVEEYDKPGKNVVKHR
eukprot:Trichotokara_eunicae@DN8205_c0_g1_i1.p1